MYASLESSFVSPSKGMIRILQSGLWFLWKSQISAILSAGECPLGNYTDKGSLRWLSLRTPSQWRGWVTSWELDVLCMLAILTSCLCSAQPSVVLLFKENGVPPWGPFLYVSLQADSKGNTVITPELFAVVWMLCGPCFRDPCISVTNTVQEMMIDMRLIEIKLILRLTVSFEQDVFATACHFLLQVFALQGRTPATAAHVDMEHCQMCWTIQREDGHPYI